VEGIYEVSVRFTSMRLFFNALSSRISLRLFDGVTIYSTLSSLERGVRLVVSISLSFSRVAVGDRSRRLVCETERFLSCAEGVNI